MKKINTKKTILIMGIPFRIEYWDAPLPIEDGDDTKYESGSIIQGRYYPLDKKILVSNLLKKESKQLVLFHELLHAYDDLIKFRDDGKSLSDSECDRIALAIREIIKEK